MFQRLANLSKSNSFFLFGARGTEKSTPEKQRFGEKLLYIDLLLADNESRYTLDSDALYREIKAQSDN